MSDDWNTPSGTDAWGGSGAGNAWNTGGDDSGGGGWGDASAGGWGDAGGESWEDNTNWEEQTVDAIASGANAAPNKQGAPKPRAKKSRALEAAEDMCNQYEEDAWSGKMLDKCAEEYGREVDMAAELGLPAPQRPVLACEPDDADVGAFGRSLGEAFAKSLHIDSQRRGAALKTIARQAGEMLGDAELAHIVAYLELLKADAAADEAAKQELAKKNKDAKKEAKKQEEDAKKAEEDRLAAEAAKSTGGFASAMTDDVSACYQCM